MKYHEFDNLRKYKIAKEKGHTTRYQEWGGSDFDGRYEEHEIRDMMKMVTLEKGSSVLVIGTGTGADSSWLSDQGYKVTGVDLIQDAIDIAKRIAAERGYDIRYVKDDITNMTNSYGKYDLIYDSNCLQSIVMDYERAAVFQFIKNHLKPDGYFVSTCAGFSNSKDYTNDIREEDTGIVYSLPATGMEDAPDSVIVDGVLYVPTRRHYTIDMYKEELERYGFNILKTGIEGSYEGLRVIAKS
jgi:2-polyprenyl-3-methyl-5-hydroxy-6-metoxy-1,4-benzoquinol methylase